jgi:tRNA(Ile)-lysidine synthase
LTGIREFAVFGNGFLARPLLDFTRAEIAAQAARWNLSWVEDPANAALRFDRSFLRARVLPALHERWPAAQRMAARLARQMTEVEQLLEEVGAQDARDFADLRRIPCAAVRTLAPARQSNLLRYVIRRLDLPMPSSTQLEQLRVAVARDWRGPGALITWPGADAHLYRDHLYLQSSAPPPAVRGPGELGVGREWRGPDGCLRVLPTDEAGFPDEWVQTGIAVRFRVGGERFRPAHHRHSKTLKHWFQENGVVPWMRDRIPLLYRHSTLVGIGDLWISEEACSAAVAGRRWRAVWSDHPPVR